VDELLKIRHAILGKSEMLDIERAEMVRQERDRTRVMLGAHGLATASFATGRDPKCQNYLEFQRMADRMRAGGYHAHRRRTGHDAVDK